MGQVVVCSNQKGGVGKTTSVLNLAAGAAMAGKTVLVVDNDPQGNASSVLAPDYQGPSIYGGGQPQPTPLAQISVVPAGGDLLERERSLAIRDHGRRMLRQLLEPIRSSYDLILIDCPPNLSLLPTNALLAADGLVIPLQCEYFALEGLGQLMRYVEDLRSDDGATVQILGVLLTMFDQRHPMSPQVQKEIERHFPSNPFKHPIPRDIALAAAASHGQTVLAYNPLSSGAVAYLAATRELLGALRVLS